MSEIYMIPVRVNERKFVTLKLSADMAYIKNNERDFVCEMDQFNGYVQLLMFQQQLKASSNLNTGRDIEISLCDVRPSDDNKFIELVFSESGEGGKDIAEEPEGLQGYRVATSLYASDSYEFSRQNDNDYQLVKVKIMLMHKGQTWSSVLKFHLVPKRDCYRLALDSGSEASQMLLMNAENNITTPVEILEQAKSKLPEYNNGHKDYKALGADKFHQYTNDGNTLFKSLFYVDLQDDAPLFLSLNAEDDKYKKRGEYALMPSLKISLLDRSGDIKMLEYYRKVVSDFIRTAICRIESLNVSGRHVGLQLYLLVPNVMSLKLVNELVRNILRQFESLQELVEAYRRFHLEVITCSESDASFVGYFNRNLCTHNFCQDKKYLTIDGGKGTMDFSVVHLNQRNKYKSLYRNGFVGSGNAVTYAIFDHICAVIVGSPDTEKRRSVMRSVLFNNTNDQAGLKRLLDVIEEIKKEYKPDEKIAQRCDKLHSLFAGQNLEELNAGGLANALANDDNGLIGSLGDKYGIIHATCAKICGLLAYNLEKNNVCSSKADAKGKEAGSDIIYFDEVILAGRAFKFKMLYDEMKRLLRENYGCEDFEVRYDQEWAKEACLNGALAWSFINCNSGINGVPCVRRAIFDKKPKSGVGKLILGGSSDSYTPLSGFEIDEDFLMNGYDLTLNPNDYLVLNGCELDRKEGYYADTHTYNLYYTEDGLLVRDESTVKSLSTLRKDSPEAQVETDMLFASRFPLYEDEDKRKISLWKMPVLDE